MFKIHIGIVLGRPTLHPTSVHACPNETLTFTCSDSQVVATLWKLDMYIEENAREITSSSQPAGSHTVIYMDMIFANLSEVINRNGSAADITTSLTVIAHGLLNRTNISCFTLTEDNVISKSSSVFYFAGQPTYMF